MQMDESPILTLDGCQRAEQERMSLLCTSWPAQSYTTVPSESAPALHKGHLTDHRIIGYDPKNAEFAYPFVCHPTEQKGFVSHLQYSLSGSVP